MTLIGRADQVAILKWMAYCVLLMRGSCGAPSAGHNNYYMIHFTFHFGSDDVTIVTCNTMPFPCLWKQAAPRCACDTNRGILLLCDVRTVSMI